VEKMRRSADKAVVKAPATNLAKRGAKRIRSTAVARASVVLAFALGLASGTSANAAPAPGASIDNPFDQKGGGEGAGKGGGPADNKASGGQASDGDARSRDEAERPAADVPAGVRDESADSGDQGDGQEADGEDEPQSALHALTCLEGDGAGGGRRKGVQRRDFLKRHRFELSGVGGFYASDSLSSTYSYGGALAYYPSEDFGVEVLVTHSPVKFRLEEPFNAFDLQRHFVPGAAWHGVFSLLWSPIHAKLKFSEQTIIHSDVFVVLGVGRTFHESVLGLTWEAGFGIKLYVSHYVTLRLDVRDFLLPQEVLGQGRITNNVTVLGGLSVWLPG
jgi:outer membrane beta-barrel protein